MERHAANHIVTRKKNSRSHLPKFCPSFPFRFERSECRSIRRIILLDKDEFHEVVFSQGNPVPGLGISEAAVTSSMPSCKV
jgi:hypothetical protein